MSDLGATIKRERERGAGDNKQTQASNIFTQIESTTQRQTGNVSALLIGVLCYVI